MHVSLHKSSTSILATQVLLKAGANMEHRTADGGVPIIYAVASGNVDTLRVLIESGADQYMFSPIFFRDRGPLYIAALSGHVEMVEYLLTLGVTDLISQVRMP